MRLQGDSEGAARAAPERTASRRGLAGEWELSQMKERRRSDRELSGEIRCGGGHFSFRSAILAHGSRTNINDVINAKTT